MKYKEIPIDDSKGIDQFKVGDRIRVYYEGRYPGDCPSKHIDGICLDVHKGLGEVCIPGIHAKWQQCRKLEKITRGE